MQDASTVRTCLTCTDEIASCESNRHRLDIAHELSFLHIELEAELLTRSYGFQERREKDMK